jgi:hypothetical protein
VSTRADKRIDTTHEIPSGCSEAGDKNKEQGEDSGNEEVFHGNTQCQGLKSASMKAVPRAAVLQVLLQGNFPETAKPAINIPALWRISRRVGMGSPRCFERVLRRMLSEDTQKPVAAQGVEEFAYQTSFSLDKPSWVMYIDSWS